MYSFIPGLFCTVFFFTNFAALLIMWVSVYYPPLIAPTIAVGVLILLVTVTGITTAYYRKVLWIFLFLLSVLILILFVLTVFGLVVTREGGAGRLVKGRAYREYELEDYSTWMQRTVKDSGNWKHIRSSLSRDSCEILAHQKLTQSQFFMKNLSSIESGCCKPPTECGFTYISPTKWAKNGNSTTNNTDCKTWSNDDSSLCYDCQSCKAGFVGMTKDIWKDFSTFNIILLVFAIIAHSFVCREFWNDRRDKAGAVSVEKAHTVAALQVV